MYKCLNLNVEFNWNDMEFIFEQTSIIEQNNQ